MSNWTYSLIFKSQRWNHNFTALNPQGNHKNLYFLEPLLVWAYFNNICLYLDIEKFYLSIYNKPGLKILSTDTIKMDKNKLYYLSFTFLTHCNIDFAFVLCQCFGDEELIILLNSKNSHLFIVWFPSSFLYFRLKEWY